VKLKNVFRRLVTQTFWRAQLGAIGPRSILFTPLLVVGPQRMFIGDRVVIRDAARLEIVRSPGAAWTPALRIGNNVNIEQGVHIICQCDVTIGNDVSITPYCAIVDTHHPHDPPDREPKIGARLPTQRSHVRIGDGSFIGAHTVILPNVTIGRGCVIGAGSVVTRDIPDYCIANGSPAEVRKVFDPASRSWHATDTHR